MGLSVASAATPETGNLVAPQPATSDTLLNLAAVPSLDIDQAVMSAAKNWTLLAVDDSGKKIKLEDLKRCSISSEEKEKLAKYLEDIWKKYPTTIEKTRGSISITFKPGVGKLSLDREEDEMLGYIDNVISEYLNRKFGHDVVIDWANVQGHPDIIYIACQKWGVSSTYAGWAAATADDPDYWAPVVPPTGWEWLDNLIRTVCHSWDHYYNPYRAPPTGFAPAQCTYYGSIAKTTYHSNLYSAFSNIGYSSHFISDVGNPMHTGYEDFQAAFQWTHSAYEGYVYSNWNSGHNFKQVLLQTNYYYPTSDMYAQTSNLAWYSRGQLDTLWWEVYNNDGQIQNNTNVLNITDNCLYQTEMRVLGLVRYVLD
jgi:hypothetical protein